MYYFTDIDEPAYNSRYTPESLLLHDENGEQRVIEDLVPGFQTLQTSGRFGLARKPLGEEPETRDGALYFGTRVAPRVITVTYQLLSKTAREQWDRFFRLRSIMVKALDVSPLKDLGLIEIAFFDKPLARHFVALPTIEEPDPGRLNVVCEMSFYSPDPHIYSPPITAKTGEVLSRDFDATDSRRARIMSLDLVAEETETIKITTGDQVTTLTRNRSIDNLGNEFSDEEGNLSNTYQAGEKIHLDCLSGKVTANGVNRVQDLTLMSAFPSLYLDRGEAVEVEGANGSYIYRAMEGLR